MIAGMKNACNILMACLPLPSGMKRTNTFCCKRPAWRKAFFYWFNGIELLFASEMKALWAAGVEKKLNERLLYNFITLGYTQNPSTLQKRRISKSYKLPAASLFTYNIHNKILHRNPIGSLQQPLMPL